MKTIHHKKKSFRQSSMYLTFVIDLHFLFAITNTQNKNTT